MNTSDGLAAPIPATPATDATETLARAVEQLANAYFTSFPGQDFAAAPPHFGPSALNVGAGGASPSVSLPPIPGPLKSPPLATAPPPKESDFRAIPTLLSENAGMSSPIALASGNSPEYSVPYYLTIAGLPGRAGESVGAPTAALSAPAIPAGATSLGSGQSPSVDRLGRDPVPPHPWDLGDTAVSTHKTGGVPSTSERREYDETASQPIGVSEYRSGLVPQMPHATDAGSAPRYGDLQGRSAFFEPGHVDVVPRSRPIFDPYAIKRDFPILQERVHGRKLVWLDNGATTQKPRAVIDRLSAFYEHENSNVHRGAHALAARSTDAYEGAREKVGRFLNASSPKEIVFVRGTTEGINLIAKSWGKRNLGSGDEIVITWLEHHANIVPWQQLCAENGCRLRVAPVDDRGQVILEEYEKLLNPRTRLVSFTHVSNALGTIVPAREMIAAAHRYGAIAHVDGAQAVAHMPVDVQELDADFYTFSGHKVFGPTGIGVVFGKIDLLETMPPWQGGGNMIADVTFERTTYQPAPGRFEAGTGNIADAVGLGAALDYVTAIGLESASQYEHDLLAYGTARLFEVPGLRLVGTAANKAGVMSFVVDGLRTEDVGSMLDKQGVAVRAGHHCAQPILRRYGLETTVRATLALYNTPDDIDALVNALKKIRSGMGG